MSERQIMTCLVPGCDAPIHRRTWCVRHYGRWLRHGDPLGLAKRPTVAERLWAKVDFHGPMQSPYLGPCWVWSGALTAGYGCLETKRVRDGSRLAHRIAYELVRGEITDETLDHLCRNPRCVNPAHLEPVSQRENKRRGESGRNMRERTHCPQGHAYDELNTRIARDGHRVCITCSRQTSREYARRQREKTAA